MTFRTMPSPHSPIGLDTYGLRARTPHTPRFAPHAFVGRPPRCYLADTRFYTTPCCHAHTTFARAHYSSITVITANPACHHLPTYPTPARIYYLPIGSIVPWPLRIHTALYRVALAFGLFNMDGHTLRYRWTFIHAVRSSLLHVWTFGSLHAVGWTADVVSFPVMMVNRPTAASAL